MVFSCSQPAPSRQRPRVLVVVEGPFDIEFLRRISTILAAGLVSVPDLADMERRHALVFLPFGGDAWLWTERLAPLGFPEFHLYDREMSPETELRARAAHRVNLRAGCQAVLTTKRSIENYLHPQAVVEACGVAVEFGDQDPVADLIAEQLHSAQDAVPWPQLPHRTHKRRRNRTKRILHTKWLNHTLTTGNQPYPRSPASFGYAGTANCSATEAGNATGRK